MRREIQKARSAAKVKGGQNQFAAKKYSGVTKRAASA
jgi:hypothetical protein